ncbi:MAG: hypothetical protein WCE75_03490 [Terracidiphilus sp.]
MKKKWIFFVAPPAAVLITGLCGWLVESLWNWLVPPITGWHTVGFWQALGLLLLCRILFGSWAGGGGGDHGQRYAKCKGKQMTEEERERLRQGLSAPPAEPIGESTLPA